jgi:putative membrane protein
VILRPYVFLFLLAYLILAVAAWGWMRALLYAVLGYGIAWAAEFSSIHNGFPFGPYAYISAPTIDRELWIAGVPFMDSLSFVFLTFAGLQMARLVTEPLAFGPLGTWDRRWAEPARPVRWRTWLLGGLLTMGLDMVIDPVALRGDRWFLGQLYYYPEGGPYFGVPLANFAGWALVSWAVIGSFLLLDRRLLQRFWGGWRSHPADALGGAGLFLGVLAFNLAATFAIGEGALGMVGCLWGALMVAPALIKLRGMRPVMVAPSAEGAGFNAPAS